MAKEIIHRHRQIVVGVHQAYTGRNNAMAVKIDIIAEGDIELVFHRHQIRHSIRRRTVHADFAVIVQGHKREGMINAFVDHFKVQTITLGYRLPKGNAGTTQGVNPNAHTSIGDCLHVKHILQIFHIGADEIKHLCRFSRERLAQGQAFDIAHTVGDDFVGAVLNPFGDIRIRGTT